MDNNNITNEREGKYAFEAFLEEVSELSCETNTTATGTVTIQQSLRNDLRKRGVKALVEDLKALYGHAFDVLETREGIIIAAENEPGGWTFSWELKNTIKRPAAVPARRVP